MAIFTNKLEDNKKQDSEQLDPEVVTEDINLVHPDEKKEELSIAVVALTRPRKRHSVATVCVLLTALVVFAIGILGGIYLYNRLAHRKYEGWCGVSYNEHHRLTDDYIAGMPGDRQYYNMKGEFEEHIEIDHENGKYEKIAVPSFADVKRATILHDFDKNFTAIVDGDNARCFIIPLNRTMVKPPRDFWDLLSKLRNGYYLPDTEVVREKYRVITPRIDNIRVLGYYIWKECRYYDTFKMVREGEPVALSRRKKRAPFDCTDLINSKFSLGSSGSDFMQFVVIDGCL